MRTAENRPAPLPVAPAQGRADQRRAARGHARAHGNDDEKHGQGQGERGQGLGGPGAGIGGVHHVVHGVEEEGDGSRDGQASNQRGDRGRGQVLVGAVVADPAVGVEARGEVLDDGAGSDAEQPRPDRRRRLISTAGPAMGRRALFVQTDVRDKASVQAMVVPVTEQVKAQAEAEGLDKIFKSAGGQWRFAGCSMCLGMNPDQLDPGERCASTSNRNFEGRQGRGGRTHLLSPAMAAAAAVIGSLLGLPALDSVGALVIALFIVRMGWRLGTTNVMALMDTLHPLNRFN